MVMHRIRTALAALVLLIASSLVIPACGVDAEACEYGSDCLPGFYCFAGSCRELPQDCPEPVRCDSCAAFANLCKRTLVCTYGDGLTAYCK